MATPQDVMARAAATYNAASDWYDHPANSFWERFGLRTIERLELKPGELVLDACCGSGASAIPAAERVGREGFVLGVDLSERLLELARAKAEARGLENAGFQAGDILDLGLTDGSFDAVACVFGIFLAPDMPAAVRELWRLTAPGGRLAVTTWGGNLFEPANTIFWNAVRAVRPDLHRGFNPWDRIGNPAALRALLREAGVESCEVEVESGSQPLDSPDDWWTLVLGSGYRGTVEELRPEERETVREACLTRLREAEVRWVETSVLYALAVKP